jgi:hypothetical protein
MDTMQEIIQIPCESSKWLWNSNFDTTRPLLVLRKYNKQAEVIFF